MILPNELFDTVLVMAGVVLVVTGLVMFIRSKTSTQASSVEAFGIKLNVTHPSLILVLAGVGLMLAPRLLPEPPGKTDKPEAVVAEAAKPQAPAVPASPAPVAAIQPVPTPAAIAPPARPAPKPTATLPAVAPPAATARSTRITKPTTSAPVRSKRLETKPASSHPAARTATTASMATAPSSAAEAAIPPPATATKPARPTLVYAALGLPTSRTFWSGETRASYTRRMQASLQQAGREVLRMNTREQGMSPQEFDAWLNESGQHPRSRELCATSPAPRALLAARVETPSVYSSIESAFWPELKLRLFVCANQRMYRQQKTLSPQNGDAWPFATELNSEIERFLRAYRSDLAD